MKVFFLLFYLTASLCVAAQNGNAGQKTAIQKLHWMVGNWSGTSIALRNEGNRITNIRESVSEALDGTLLLIHVTATDKDSDTQRQSIAYTAFSVISYDVTNEKYRWTTWRNSGVSYDEHSFTVGDRSFEYITEEKKQKVRYKAMLSEENAFLETGEFFGNDDKWIQFITMKLMKKRK